MKALLNLIEYPPAEYEKIVVLVVSSEDVSKTRIGRHDWAILFSMWNMGWTGFTQLYNLIPSPKPSPREAWRLTGGNPRMLERLHVSNWDTDKVVGTLIASKRLRRLVESLSRDEKRILEEALENPDILLKREAHNLADHLIELNMVAEIPGTREPYLWVDEPPPEKNPELGIGQYYAWQTPLHREAAKRILEALNPT